MARTLSAAFTTGANASQTAQVYLYLVKIDVVPELRFVCNQEDVTSNGETYTAWYFEMLALNDDPEQLPRVTISICNIDRSILEALRGIASPPTIHISVVLASTPDTVEVGPLALTLKNIDYDAFMITGELGFNDIMNEGVPKDSFDQNTAPGLY